MKIQIKDAAIITLDPENTQFPCGSLCIDDGTITYIGSNEGAPVEFTPDRVIDGRGCVVLPGLINCHTHLGMTLFRGYANDMPLWEWLSERIWPLEDRLTSKDVYWASLLGMMEMLRSGTTTFSDMYFFMDEVAQGVKESGIRAVLARGLQGTDANSDFRLKENRELFHAWNGQAEGRIRVMVGPHAEYTCSPAYLKSCAELAGELDVGIHIHLSETWKETRECQGRHGKTPTQLLLELGLLDHRVTAAHCVAVSEEDQDILAEKGVHVIHNPGSNLKLASGFAPVVSMLKKGINVCLGTDSAASNNNLNLLEEVFLAALVHKGTSGDPTVVSAPEALKMATVNAARALGWEEEIGSLVVGKRADLIMVEWNQPHYYPKTDFITHLVYSGQAADVRMTMVQGRVLMEKGEFLTIDQDRVFWEIERIAERLYQS